MQFVVVVAIASWLFYHVKSVGEEAISDQNKNYVVRASN